jgi:hypothetical protein
MFLNPALGGMMQGGQLRIKRLITSEEQDVEVCVGSAFSLRQYLRSVGREYDPMTESLKWNFSLSLGRYEVYETFTFAAGMELFMLELAVTTVTAYSLISEDRMFGRVSKIRQRMNTPPFKYFEIQL